MNDQKNEELAVSSQKVDNKQSSSSLLKSLSVIGYTSSYIFGPMIIFGCIGWWLNNKYNNKALIVFPLLFALVISNILIFKNTKKIIGRISQK